MAPRASLRLAHIPPPFPPIHARPSSPELGDPFFRLPIPSDKATARPQRRTAGKKTADPAFVDSNSILDDLEPFHDSDDMGRESESFSSGEDERPRKKVKKAAPKKKRLPSPPPPVMSPIHSDMEDDVSSTEGYEQDDSQLSNSTTSSGSVSLTFNVPQGFNGPFIVQLDASMINSSLSQAKPPSTPSQSIRRRPRTQVDLSSSQTQSSQNLFLKLPPELRNKIYRLVFVDKSEFRFWTPDNFCHSSAFLQTCKLICEEGSSILYSENTFCFERSRHMRGQFWSAERKEIGYKDMRRFLSDIGPRNLGFIRKLSLTLEDANPSSAPYHHDPEKRRFVHDGHLLECLRMLSRQSKLKWLRLSFQGRRRVTHTDHRFLEILKAVKTDKIDITPNPRYAYHSSFSKIDWLLEDNLKTGMVRKEKLFLN